MPGPVRELMAPHNRTTESAGPELMELMRQQARNFGTRIVTDDIVEVDFGRHPFRVHVAGRQDGRGQGRDRGHRRPGELSGPAVGRRLQEPGRQRLRRVRRRAAAVSQQAADRGRRRRLGRRRGDVSVQVRQPRPPGPSPRPAAGVEDHGRAGAWPTARIEPVWNHELVEVLGDRQRAA